MARFRPNAELDARLDRIKACTRVYLCSSQPTTFAEAVAAALGYYDLTSGDYSADADYTGAEGGRYTSVAAKSGNNATATGSGTHLALVIEASSELREVVVCGSISVTTGQPFNIQTFDIVEQDPAAPV